mgnify:CR=1 FL=1
MANEERLAFSLNPTNGVPFYKQIILQVEMGIADGRLKRTYSAGEARLNAYVNDYAFVVDGLLRLHRASGDKRWLTAISW